MVPTTKISQTLLEFGKDLILSLPENHSKEEFEATMRVVISTWNAVVIDSWNKNNEGEKQLLKALDEVPKEVMIFIKRLLKRKKTKYSSDPRAVGDYWVREENGEFIFGCEARIDIEKIQASGSIH